MNYNTMPDSFFYAIQLIGSWMDPNEPLVEALKSQNRTVLQQKINELIKSIPLEINNLDTMQKEINKIIKDISLIEESDPAYLLNLKKLILKIKPEHPIIQ